MDQQFTPFHRNSALFSEPPDAITLQSMKRGTDHYHWVWAEPMKRLFDDDCQSNDKTVTLDLQYLNPLNTVVVLKDPVLLSHQCDANQGTVSFLALQIHYFYIFPVFRHIIKKGVPSLT